MSRFKLIILLLISILLSDDCTDFSACNYNPNAQSDDGSCYYPIECPDNSLECDINNCSVPNGFEWNQSTKILFLFVDYAYRYNSNFPLLDYEDWIGAFKSYDETKNGLCEAISDNCPDINLDGLLTENVEVCIGSKYWNGENNTEIPLMAYQSNNHLTNGYLESGDSPYFKLFDSTTDSLYLMTPFKDGQPYELSYNGSSSIEIILIDSLISQCPFYNNFDSDQDSLPDTCDACPNDPNNDVDNDNICFPTDSCPYDNQNDIDGDGICSCTFDNLLDCQDVIDNDPLVNSFDICPLDANNDIDGDGICGDIDDCPNDPYNLDQDQDGICDDIDECVGIYDDCGLCNGNNISKDCNEDCFGEAFIDYCGACVGGNTLFEAGFLDLGCGCGYSEPLAYCYDSDNDGLGNLETETYYCPQDTCYQGCGDLVLPSNEWILNCSDNCPNDSDNDIDGDGICGNLDDYPNCTENYEDCTGQCGGQIIIDNCDECGGNNYDQCDFDSDGIININDSCPTDSNNDIDGDGICGDIDICPYDSQNDIDGDGICGDIDNCPNDHNNDIDGDGICGDIDEYPDCYFNYYDCFGDCGGQETLDDCGVCGGTGNCDCPDYESGIEPDCNGICGGIDIVDNCGICGGNNIDKDCAGECFGIAIIDECGECSGGTSNHVANSDQDCNGDCFGQAIIDDCGICSNGATDHVANSDQDCNGDCFGSLILDECGICGGNGIAEDECDCNGNIFDCTQTCGGEAIIDDCDICSNGNSGHQFNSDIDCNGVCFGDGIDNDNDNICDGIDDCIGEYDVCDICNGDGTWCLSTDIYFGNLTENHLEIMYDSPLDIGGFQFSIYGLHIINAFGGASEDSHFNTANNNDTVLSFSLTGNSISSGSGLLIMLSINYINSEVCLDNVTLSDNDGDEINSNLGNCIQIPCYDSDMDTICDQADDCFGIVDECGECNGDGINEGECNCSGNILDCEGVCGGNAIIDDCGICSNGETDHDANSDQDCNGDCFGEAFIDYCGDCVGGNTPYEEGFLDLGCSCDNPGPMQYCYDSDGDGLGNPGTETYYCTEESDSNDYEAFPENWTLNCNDICIDDIDNDADSDGICESDEIFGCDDLTACNYNNLSTENDGSCIYFEFSNLYPENNDLFFINNDNIDESIVFEWQIPNSECDYDGNYRLYIFDEDFNPIFFSNSNNNSVNISYEDLQIEDSIINYYNWNVEAINEDFISDYSQFIIDAEFLENNFDIIPDNFFISDTYPNPFNPQTSFNYGIPYSAVVDINIYNSIGQNVYKSNQKYHQPGIYSFVWNPSGLTSGIYYIQLKTKDIIINKKTTYIK